jgi:hypothetical protein
MIIFYRWMVVEHVLKSSIERIDVCCLLVKKFHLLLFVLSSWPCIIIVYQINMTVQCFAQCTVKRTVTRKEKKKHSIDKQEDRKREEDDDNNMDP